MERAKIERVGFVIDTQLEGWSFNLEGRPLEIGDSSFAGWEIRELKEISERLWGLNGAEVGEG